MRIKVWTPNDGSSMDVVFSYSKQQPEEFFNPDVFQTAMLDRNLSKVNLAYMFLEDHGQKKVSPAVADKQLTQQDVNDILEKYVETQMTKKEAMARMADKVNVFRNVEFYEKGKDGKIYKTKYGIENIIRASTGKGKYKVNPNLIYGLAQGDKGQGVFVPDSISSGQIKNMLVERKFPPELIQGLKRLEGALTGQPLRKVAE